MLFGVPESTVEGEVRRLFADGPDLPSVINHITEVVRLGRKLANAARPRPILIKFNSTAAKLAAFKFSRRLRGRSISMVEDLTPEQQKERKRRIPEMQQLISKGYTAFWRGADIFVRSADGKVNPTCPSTRRANPPTECHMPHLPARG